MRMTISNEIGAHAFILGVVGAKYHQEFPVLGTERRNALRGWSFRLRRPTVRGSMDRLEQSRGALVYMLAKYAHLVLFPVHPTTAARYRETFCTSGPRT